MCKSDAYIVYMIQCKYGAHYHLSMSFDLTLLCFIRFLVFFYSLLVFLCCTLIFAHQQANRRKKTDKWIYLVVRPYIRIGYICCYVFIFAFFLFFYIHLFAQVSFQFIEFVPIWIPMSIRCSVQNCISISQHSRNWFSSRSWMRNLFLDK